LNSNSFDVVTNSCDIVQTDSSLETLPHVLDVSKKMMKKIKWNVIFSMTLNFASIVLSGIGLLNPITGALTHNVGSVAVVVNSMTLLWYKRKGK